MTMPHSAPVENNQAARTNSVAENERAAHADKTCASPYAKRIERVMKNLTAQGLSQLLVSDARSIQYLTGAYIEPGERFLGLVLTADNAPVLILNELFSAPANIECAVEYYKDGEDPLAHVERACNSAGGLGCDKNFAARFLIPLIERCAASRFALASCAVDSARAIKDETERALMRQASLTNDAAMKRFRELVHPGVTEAEVAGQLEAIYRDLGASGHSFAPIVSFGANAADPHHEPDATPLRPGDVVLFDVGCRQDDYCSDMTRTFFTQQPTELERNVYETVHRAGNAARALVAPGVRFCDIDAAARTIIEKAGFGPHFTHRLGHQIGLDVHEPGDVSGANDACVAPGMVFSIEPGIYLPGEFGVRIEDLVLVTEDGCEVLNHYSRELEVL